MNLGREPHPNRQNPNKAVERHEIEVTPNRVPQQAKKSFAAKVVASGYPTIKPVNILTSQKQQT